MASKAWMCLALLTFSNVSWSYRYESLFNPNEADVSSNEHGDHYNLPAEYRRWNFSNRTNARSGNSTFKIINIKPLQMPDQRVRISPKPKESAATQHDEIVFPEPAARPHYSRPAAPPSQFVMLEVPESCKTSGDTLCMDVPNYPEEYIDNIIINSAEEWQATVDHLVEEEVKINQRIGDDPDEFGLCSSREKIVYPKAAENKDGKWISVVNTPRHEQGFRVEICATQKAPCHSVATFRFGMVATCKQKYVLREMKALDSNGQVFTDYFKLSSCCMCVVKQDDTK